jgi:hypothetical protein
MSGYRNYKSTIGVARLLNKQKVLHLKKKTIII